MSHFIIRSKRDPNTGMIVYTKAEIGEPAEPTIDDLRKEIATLKKALIGMVELQAENKMLKQKIANFEYRKKNKPILENPPEPTKDQLLAVVAAIPELGQSKDVTSFYKNDDGVWVEGTPTRRVPKPKGK